MIKVFFSHASQDKDVVRQIADAIASDDIDPWIDDRELLSGAEALFSI